MSRLLSASWRNDTGFWVGLGEDLRVGVERRPGRDQVEAGRAMFRGSSDMPTIQTIGNRTVSAIARQTSWSRICRPSESVAAAPCASGDGRGPRPRRGRVGRSRPRAAGHRAASCGSGIERAVAFASLFVTRVITSRIRNRKIANAAATPNRCCSSTSR